MGISSTKFYILDESFLTLKFRRGKWVNTWQKSQMCVSLLSEAQIPLRRLRRHKSQKSQTQTISTCRVVCDKVRDKPVYVALMEFGPRQVRKFTHLHTQHITFKHYGNRKQIMLASYTKRWLNNLHVNLQKQQQQQQ